MGSEGEGREESGRAEKGKEGSELGLIGQACSRGDGGKGEQKEKGRTKGAMMGSVRRGIGVQECDKSDEG